MPSRPFPGCHAKNSLLGQWMLRSPSALNRTSGRSCVNKKNCSGSIQASHLVRDLSATRLAWIAPEQFFLFTQERPEVRLRADGEQEELFRVYPGQPRGREVADQVAQGARCRLAGINPSPKRHHHRCQVSRRLAVKLYMVHVHPLGSGERRSPPKLTSYASKARLGYKWCQLQLMRPTGFILGV